MTSPSNTQTYIFTVNYYMYKLRHLPRFPALLQTCTAADTCPHLSLLPVQSRRCLLLRRPHQPSLQPQSLPPSQGPQLSFWFLFICNFSLCIGLFTRLLLVFSYNRLKSPIFEMKCSSLTLPPTPPLSTVAFISFKLNHSRKLPSLPVSFPFHPTHSATHSNLAFAPLHWLLMDLSVDQFDRPM